MIVKLWLQDTIARRFALTILLAALIVAGLAGLFSQFAGVWGGPPLRGSGMLERADEIIRLVEAVPNAERQHLADIASQKAFRVDWYAADSAIAAKLNNAPRVMPAGDPNIFQVEGRQRRLIFFTADDAGPVAPDLPYDRVNFPNTGFFGVGLQDQSWIVFTIPTRFWGLGRPARLMIGLTFLLVSIIVVSGFAAYQLARPIKSFTEAVRRFGVDPRQSPVPESGPRELRAAIGAFNAMQTQIGRFVEDRTAMLAAISHDLRTPLTRMRLRAEFVDDDDQRRRLSRDVDDMQVMIESALSFFRDDLQDEASTMFDFPELLRTIADDYGDQGIDVPYHGPERAVFRGRPFALKRAFTNLIDNAVKYAEAPEIELFSDPDSVGVVIWDRGPGIPSTAVERVFAPFYRMERSRNRATGGVGLGLTSARAVIRGHGGEIDLCNRDGGGLKVSVTLPREAPAA